MSLWLPETRIAYFLSDIHTNLLHLHDDLISQRVEFFVLFLRDALVFFDPRDVADDSNAEL